jgi:hypothetical protein
VGGARTPDGLHPAILSKHRELGVAVLEDPIMNVRVPRVAGGSGSADIEFFGPEPTPEGAESPG